ncbi:MULTISPECIES: type I-B CRISPR-associated protein Cas5b [unclassified Thermotoga]|uniref:type I-B CRISPR-associated protein Cas5b n=1 Tax=unclassified Thermotoga TaxID=2631113 RepID=UPI000540C1EF|nr:MULTISPECIES: type I-B CRISPR-associated protein Cas5b [unclassified Thermotoga]AIY88339.1 CRISPR-associated Cas5 family protein [Thermotoga sp. Cell2]KHC95508.1 CRISPR-associated Cas5 family protein [Thermotoga sp. TBGT1765]KHC95821.1 CRISPR-associated Cas5 family protein [Thermotoga sp. TBGT1766]KHC97007.1 CRISPR-associated Cas5 family protein [Thermotoga sp. Xyl54]
MKLLRIEIRASTAHFAIPFFIFERKTFPIPMYSTAIGLICNILNDDSKIESFLNSEFSMAIVGNHEGVVEEYTWLRNLKKDSHIEKFKILKNREINHGIEHPGGQMPTRIQTLVNPRINLFIKAREDVLEMIKQSLENSEYISKIHLGRSEDTVDEINYEFVNCEKKKVFSTGGYTWIPSPEFAGEVCDNYDELYQEIIGSSYKVSSIYTIKNNKRVFDIIPAKLFYGSIPLVHFDVPEILSWNNIPIFLAKIRKSDRGG